MAGRNGAGNVAVSIGIRIESLRLERGLSLRKLAKMADCSITTLSLMESGLTSIHARTLLKVAEALQIRPLDLLNDTPENDDIGYIVEKTRNNPTAFAKVKAKAEAWQAGRGR